VATYTVIKLRTPRRALHGLTTPHATVLVSSRRPPFRDRRSPVGARRRVFYSCQTGATTDAFRDEFAHLKIRDEQSLPGNTSTTLYLSCAPCGCCPIDVG